MLSSTEKPRLSTVTLLPDVGLALAPRARRGASLKDERPVAVLARRLVTDEATHVDEVLLADATLFAGVATPLRDELVRGEGRHRMPFCWGGCCRKYSGRDTPTQAHEAHGSNIATSRALAERAENAPQAAKRFTHAARRVGVAQRVAPGS